jgi:tRNA pseudouridine38-40 synthase
MRYFLEVAYKGTHYKGFQVQVDVDTIQSEVERAFRLLQRATVEMYGSSRTDAGVHALQNFFHFDYEGEIHPQFLYKTNAILPPDIVIKNIVAVRADAHCRFDARNREYRYYIYRNKNPFLEDRAYFYPYTLDIALLQEAATVLMAYTDFSSFSKRKTNVKHFLCDIFHSQWQQEDDCIVYTVKANRFLRGMVRGLVATMLQAGCGKMDMDRFKTIIEAQDCTKADFSAPAHGLFLVKIDFKEGIFTEG